MLELHIRENSLIISGPINTPSTKDYNVSRSIIVGRSKSCDIAIDDLKISRKQIRFFRDFEGRLFVEDLQSRNGTLVNDKPVHIKILNYGDIVKVGKSTFAVGMDSGRKHHLKQCTNCLVKDVSSLAVPNLEEFTQDHATSLSHQLTNELSTQRFSDLFAFSQLLQAKSDPEKMLKAFLERLLHCQNGDFAGLFMVDDGGLLTPRAVVSHDETDRPFTLSKTVIEHVFERGCAVIAPDLHNDDRFSNAFSIKNGAINSLLAVPLIIGHKTCGVLAVCQIGYTFHSELDLDFLFIAASILGPGLQNLDLAKQHQDDIVALKSINSKLLSTQKKLIDSEKLALIGKLSGGLLHEINNLLSPLSIISDITEDHGDNEDLQELSDIIEQVQLRSTSLIDEFKFFSSGQRPENKLSRLDLNILVQNVIPFVQHDPRIRDISIVSTLSAEPILVWIDNTHIIQVLINLIRNAADAIIDRPNGIITIATSCLDDKALLTVTDNGEGIPDVIQEHIFEPLFSTKGAGGLGLGLDICKRIVLEHNGELTFSSTPQQGTTFTLGLPSTL